MFESVLPTLDFLANLEFGASLAMECLNPSRWCGALGQIDLSGVDLRPGIIQRFLQQNVEVNGIHETIILSEVKW